jgi:hypothetical protein
VHNRGIDADDEIEVVDQRPRVGKVVEILGEIVQLQTGRRTSRLGRLLAFLQRDELHARYVAERRQCGKGDRAATIEDDLAPVARPLASTAQSDPQTGKTGKPLAPMGNIGRLCREIGRCRRNGFQRGADGSSTRTTDQTKAAGRPR